jgi:hypothetical protein
LDEYKLKEKRNYPRATIDLPVKVIFLSQGAETMGRMREVSLIGTACFLSNFVPAVNSKLMLQFSLEPYQIFQEFGLIGYVKHVTITLDEHSKEHGYPYLIGVEFVDASPEENSALEELCVTLCTHQ